MPDGKAYYQTMIRESTTLDQTPDQIHQIGLAEVAKIHAEMVETMKQSGFKGTFPDYLHFLRTDPQYYAKTPEELLMSAAWIAKQVDGKKDDYIGNLPHKPIAKEHKGQPEFRQSVYISAYGEGWAL